jgi:cytochrome c551/c552
MLQGKPCIDCRVGIAHHNQLPADGNARGHIVPNDQGVTMKKNLLAAAALVAACGIAIPALAADPEMCLDCHEPAEDWEGMSADDILAKAKDMSVKRHADNADLTDEQLKAMIAELMPK